METADQRDKPVGLDKPIHTSVAFFCDVALSVEKSRVAAQVRLSHLEIQGRKDPDTEQLLHEVQGLEAFVDARLVTWVGQHPTAEWWAYGPGHSYGVKGAGREAVGKVIGLIEGFGRWYPEGHPMIPPYIEREPVQDFGDPPMRWVWVEAIERFTTPSKLVKYAGLNPGARRVSGKLATFNVTLRTMLFRLMTSFMRQRNLYYTEYLTYKEWKRAKLTSEGVVLRTTPKGRYCQVCQEDRDVPSSTWQCPVCGEKLSGKQEPEGVIWEGHLDFMARRRAIKLFLVHLWAVWREAEGLPLRRPYPVEYRGHSQIITPWDMCDHRPEPVASHIE